ncbi:MAG: LPXTG cell wall anchor domain-containing protein [Actinomycetota bacterium]
MRPRQLLRSIVAATVLATAVYVGFSAAAAANECIGRTVTDAKMRVGGPSGIDVPVDLPAGEVTFVVRTWDEYPERPAALDQVGERAIVRLYGGGVEIASSGMTPDLEDGVVAASWSASFGPVDAPAGLDRVVIEHAPSDTGAKDSLWAEVSVCVREPAPETTTTTEPAPTTTAEVTPTTVVETTEPPVTTVVETTEPAPTTAVETTVVETTEPPLTTVVEATVPAPTTDPQGVLSEETDDTTPATELQELPRTGATTDVLALVGLGLLGLGATLMIVARRPQAA